jgi:putative CocE/NonD family hydrolase
MFRRQIAFVLLFAAAVFAQAPQAQITPYEVIVQKSVMVPMRDGVKLATDIYFPARDGKPVEGKFPVIMERTPYGKATARNWANYFVPRGYIAVAQDTRGRFESEGVWRALADDPNDGHDTAVWLGKQPWFAGAIGTVGTSYPGGTQHALALGNAPYLKAMIPSCAVSNQGEYGMRHDGAWEMRFFNWIFNIAGPAGSHEARDPKTQKAIAEAGEHVREYAETLPLRKGDTPLKLIPEYEDWLIEAMSHGGNDAFWRNSGTDVVDHIAQYEDVPVLHITGWYDSWTHQVADMTYEALAKSKKSPQRLLIGPWTHGALSRSYAGEADFGPDSTVNLNDLSLRWFDHWLKGENNGAEKDAPVRIFVMGGGDAHKTPEGRIFVGGHWRDEQSWPLQRAVATTYYLHANGRLSAQKPGLEKPTQYEFDPRHPVPTIGGNISSENAPPSKHSYPERPGDTANLMERGAWDQRCRPQLWNCDNELPLSSRNDILVFESAPLAEDMEVTGPLLVKLWASSDAPDTDFTAKLIDVYPPNADFPGGVALNVGDSIVRARYREGVDKPAKLMAPGTIYPFTIQLYPTSLVFKKGHRIRVDISSSNFPRFDVNPNTGEPLNDNRRERIAINTIYHDAQHPSQIVLPVIPGNRD